MLEKTGKVLKTEHCGAFALRLLPWKNKIITYSKSVCVCVCVCVALGIQYVMWTRHSIICGLHVSTIFHKWHDFEEKKRVNIKCVF